jgi:hypothetical protein
MKTTICHTPQMSVSQNQENQFIIKCKVCGKFGRVILKRDPREKIRQRQHRSRASHPKPKSEFKTKHDYRGNPFDVPINRTEHPYRYLGVLDYFCGLKPTNRHVVINLPKPQPRESKTSNALHDLAKSILLCIKIAPLVEQKYPDIKAIREKNEDVLVHSVRMLRKLFNSAIDDRYKRSLAEWAQIVREAKEHSARVAAKKYSGTTPNGIDVRLSIKSIREKMKDPEIQKFFDTYSYYETIFFIFIGIIIGAVEQDPELLAIYKQYERDYDDSNKKLVKAEKEEEGSKRGQVLVNTPEQNDYKEQQCNDDDGHNKESYYEYFVIRHYDPDCGKNRS